METGDARDCRSQSAIYYGGRFDRWRSDRGAIPAGAVYRFEDLEIFGERKVERNAELSALYPDAVANIVHADLADGRRLTRRVDYPMGHAKNPLKDSQVEEKFEVLVHPMLGRERARKILDMVWKLDEARKVNELMEA